MRHTLLAALIVSIAVACATQPVPISQSAPSGAGAVDLEKAAAAIRGSTKAAVTATLGPASVVRFDSGYEVWAYRFVTAAAGEKSSGKAPVAPTETQSALSELVLLFNPSGVVDKVRIRPPSPTASGSND